MKEILIVEDDADLRLAIAESFSLKKLNFDVAENMNDAILKLAHQEYQLMLSDCCLGDGQGFDLMKRAIKIHPHIKVILMTAYGTIPQAVVSMQEGASDYIIKPFSIEEVISKIRIHLPKYAESSSKESIVVDPASIVLYEKAKKVAHSDVTVLLTGPSGAGKEVLSRYIHQNSLRSQEAFVAINCAAIPENMLEATLFGYEKGAFTGAVQSMPGKFEQAQKGTLLLDEISEMSLNLQAKILRALQEKQVERLGSRKTIDLDVRVIATSNRNLEEEVKNKNFREDLFYRLNVFPLECMSLSQRKEDIIPLANFFLKKYAKKRNLIFSQEAQKYLQNYQWPGNVRELENVVQRAIVLSDKEIIQISHLNIFNAGDAARRNKNLEKNLSKDEVGR